MMTIRSHLDRRKPSFSRRTVFVCVLSLASLLTAPVALAQNPAPVPRRAPMDPVATKAAQALEALFARSDLDAARAAARDTLQLIHRSRLRRRSTSQAESDALFVEMEAASLQADTRAELEAALRLCELHTSSDDARISVATSRILDLAANTPDFRAAVPRVHTLLARDSAPSNELRAALLAAADDGAPGLSASALAHESGLITDWRIAGPFGQYANVAFERAWDPEHDGMTRPSYNGRIVEQFRFDNGKVILPKYFSEVGVFYASAKISLSSPGNWTLRIESPGTIQAWVNGTLVLTKDDRFHATPETVSMAVPLRAGMHRVFVKFLPSAAPFRLAFLPPSPKRTPATTSTFALTPSTPYITAERAFWSGDYAQAIELLTRLRATHESAAVDFLLAQAWSRSSDNASERKALLDAALKAAPTAHAVEYELASIAFSERRFDQAFDAARRVLASEPRFEPAAILLAASAARLNQSAEAAEAFQTAAALHPSCSVLKQAATFFAGISDFTHAQQYESQLQDCAPASLAWAEALSAAGHHAESASADRQLIASHPLNRSARAHLIRELMLSGKEDDARAAALELAALAPNSSEFRRMAATLDSGDELLDSAFADPHFADPQQFYSPYRRDGIEVMKQTSGRNFSGGPILLLLNDRVAEVRRDGTAALYVHQLTRILDRDGLAQYGEVAIPTQANLLELRTIKSDGRVVEPELNQHKGTISMPALEVGDAIDLEYVIPDLDGGVAGHPDAFQFTFGSFAAPTILSRFIVTSPEDDVKLKFVPFGDIPVVTVRTSDGVVTRSWQANDVPQSVSEVSMPRSGVLPSIQVLAAENGDWASVRDFYRDKFIDAARVGLLVESVARNLPGANAGSTDEQRLRAAFRFVTSRLRGGNVPYESGDVPSAESTLASFRGSRSAALLALARALGIPGYILMARDVGPQMPTVPSPYGYTHPLLVFRLNAGAASRDIVLDPETDGIGFGGVAATLERKDALFIPIDSPGSTEVFAAIPPSSIDDHSTAEGDVSFNSDGDLSAHLLIRMGAARGAQMRTLLSTIEPADRKGFFEHLATRIFPGVSYTDGKVQNESDTDAPLILTIDCRAAHFADFSKPVSELDQLVPALGLERMYATSLTRRTPLLIDTPLFETTTFRIHLPDGVRFADSVHDVARQTVFGNYSVTFRQSDASTIQVRRQFNIPVQIVEVRQSDAFARFAHDIDDAERQHLTVLHSKPGLD
jgi:tetratricopeptide (TPR) repeat protein